MSGRSAKCALAALCLSSLLSAGPSPLWEWMTAAWSALAAPPAAGEAPPEGWLTDPNG